MEVIIIDSGCANIASVRYAFERMGYKAHATSDKRQINCKTSKRQPLI